jgi:hypothetical protein
MVACAGACTPIASSARQAVAARLLDMVMKMLLR